MYKRVPIKKLKGKECFKNTGKKDVSILDFWQYGFSNLNSNILRGILAEFLIENALKNYEDITVRNPWGDYDVEYKGKKIEVKCCSYIQDWDEEKLSNIIWSGLKAKTLYWSSAVSEKNINQIKEYKADIYVFALLIHQTPSTLDILDMDQWCFYVLTKEKLKEISNDGNSISLVRLKKNNIKSVDFINLSKAIILN